MTLVRVNSFAISVDGFGAGPNQGMQNPLGVGGTALHQWGFGTRTFRQMSGGEGGTTGVFAGIDLVALGYTVAEHVGTDSATDVVLRKADDGHDAVG